MFRLLPHGFGPIDKSGILNSFENYTGTCNPEVFVASVVRLAFHDGDHYRDRC